MINSEHFTKAEESNKPDVSGHYLVVLEQYNITFFEVCSYSRTSNPPAFQIIGDGTLKDAKVIGWCLIDDAKNIAYELSKS